LCATTRSHGFYEPLEPRQLLAGDARPTAVADAAPLALWGSTYAFRVTYADDQSINSATLDSGDVRIVGPNGYNRNAKFYRLKSTRGGSVVYGYYKIAAPGGVWDAADNGAYALKLNPSQVRDRAGNVAPAVKIGSFTVNVPQYPSDVAAGMVTKGIVGVDVTRFGATPNDGTDDTDAIQRAIDSLPYDGDGVPDAQHVLGGTVVLPKGTFNTSRPLTLPSAVRVHGQGASTVILNRSTDGNRGAFELVSDTPSGFNIGAGVEHLRLVTDASKGIRAAGLRGDLNSLRLTDLTISAGGVAIDLREARAYATDIRNVTITNPGSTALWIGPENDGWVSNVNRISGLRVTGTARAGFAAERGMVVLGGDVSVDGLIIDEARAPVTPLYVRGSPVIMRSQIRAGGLQDGVVARFDNCADVSIDRLDLGEGQRLDLVNTRHASVGNLNLTSAGSLMGSVALEGDSHLTVHTLRSAGDAGRVTDDRINVVARAGLLGATSAPAFTDVKRPASQTVRDVTQFGAIPNDGIDDTAAIQRAIDALPTGTGVPGFGAEQTGGLVLLPAGRFDTSAPLLVPSGVWLRGQGNATVIHNASSDAGRGAVELVTRHPGAANIGAGAEDLSIYTTSGLGIRADGAVTGGLIDLRLNNVMVGSAGVAVDLGAVRTYHASITNLVFSHAGSSGLILGDAEGFSADNRVVGLRFYGGARDGFRADEALVVLRGSDTYVRGGWIEHPLVPALPLHVEGSATFRGLWLEYAPEHLPSGVAIELQDTTRVDFDRLHHISALQRMKLVNAKNVRVGMLNIAGYTVTLGQSLEVDAGSNMTVAMAVAQRDVGMLDDARVRVSGTYNEMDRTLIFNRTPAGPNLIADPTFDTIDGAGGGGVGASDGSGGGAARAGWAITWNDHLGFIQGSAGVEQGPGGPRLRITADAGSANRYVTVRATLNVPANLVGTTAIARWRIDGPGLALVYNAGYDNQYSARTMGSLTATRTPVPLRANEQVVFTLPAIGTYYISSVSLTPA
jgi:hypothetical protein